MKISTRFVVAFLALCCFNLAHAQDACKRRWDAAASEMDEARKAFEYKNWQYSSMMYQRAASRWEDAASDCSGKNRDNARENVNHARKLSEKAQTNLEIDNCKYLIEPASNSFDAAKQASQSQDFVRARDLYLQSSEQYQRAARSCNGSVAETASRNATAAANNANASSRNMEIQASQGKVESCKRDLEQAKEASQKGLDAGKQEEFKTAIAMLSRAEILYTKLAKNCQELSKSNFSETAASLKTLREIYTKEARGK
jgi:hypothetical protein